MVIPFENEGIGYFKLWERFVVRKYVHRDWYLRLYDNFGKGLTSFASSYSLPAFMFALNQNFSYVGYKITSTDIIDETGKRFGYVNLYPIPKLSNERVLIEVGRDVINMNGKVILKNGTGDYSSFSPYNGLYMKYNYGFGKCTIF